MLIDDRESKEEFPEEKDHMLRMANITTVRGGGGYLSAPYIIEEDMPPHYGPYKLLRLLNKNPRLDLGHSPIHNMGTISHWYQCLALI